MARPRKTEETMLKPTLDDLENGAIELGLQLCHGVLDGTSRNPSGDIKAICVLINVLKDRKEQ